MDNPESKLEPATPEQPKAGGIKRQSFKVAGSGGSNGNGNANGNLSQKEPPPPPAAGASYQPAQPQLQHGLPVTPPAAVDQSPDFPVEKNPASAVIERSGDNGGAWRDAQEKKLKGRRPGDRYIRLTRPSIAPNQVWEG